MSSDTIASENEIWKPIKGYEGLYSISNHGRVRSESRVVNNPLKGQTRLRERILKLNYLSNGYVHIGLSNNGICKHYAVHRLVLQAFVGDSELVVNHINSKKDDNRLENLEYVSIRENTNYSMIGKRNMLPGVSKVTNKAANGKGYQARFWNGKRLLHLGVFSTEAEAHERYLQEAMSLNQHRYIR